ncbi:MAG: hypothetical protein H6738_03045 [Alphaproteobacteria bacterium]|nr:hypothetical protein [Alphaproteobacteria bacterium]MCB9695746.1 hypothetical protein [Alphaproteobacteria bacterium]
MTEVLRPSGSTLLGALAVFLGWWALLLGLVRPDVLARVDERWLLAGPDDDYGHLTHLVLQLQRVTWGSDTLLVLGPSSTREGITSAEALGAEVTRRVGRPVATYLLAADAETPFEYAAILDAMPDGFRGVVVLGVSPSLVARSHVERVQRATDRRDLALGWRSADRDAALARVGVATPRPTGMYVLDVQDFLLPRALVPIRVLAGRQPAYAPHRSPPPRTTLDASIRNLGGKISHYAEGKEIAFPLLWQVMERFAARSTDVRFVLCEQPEWRELYAHTVGPERMESYRNHLERLAERRPDTVVLDPGVGLSTDDFADLIHLATDRGRERYTDGLARGVAETWPGP